VSSVSLSTDGIARACATRPKRTLAVWGAAVLVSFVVIALLLGNALTSDGDVTSKPDSKQAATLIREGFPPKPTPSEIVVVRSDRYTVDDAAFKAKVAALGERAQALSAFADARSYYDTDDASLVSKDRHATMVPIVVRGDDVAPLVDLVSSVNGADGFQVSITGGADHPRARVRRGRRRTGAGPARAAVDRDRGRPDGACRPGVRGLVLRGEHDLRHGPRARDRLRALHPLALPGGARP
jgi:hypothetical protein